MKSSSRIVWLSWLRSYMSVFNEDYLRFSFVPSLNLNSPPSRPVEHLGVDSTLLLSVTFG